MGAVLHLQPAKMLVSSFEIWTYLGCGTDMSLFFQKVPGDQ